MVGLVVLLYYSHLAVMHIQVCYGQTMFGLPFFLPLLFAFVINYALYGPEKVIAKNHN